MKTQAWGWLVAAVLAAGLNASYHQGGLEWAHEVADRVEHHSAAVLDLASGRVDRFLSEARSMTARNETASCKLATALARIQTRVAQAQTRIPRTETSVDRFEFMTDHDQAQLDQLEANRARLGQVQAQVEAKIHAQVAKADHLRVVVASFGPREMVSLRAPQVPEFNFSAIKVPDACPRVRVRVPRMPMVRIPAPVVHIERMNAGPV